jgi:MSHA pilin protein MshC
MRFPELFHRQQGFTLIELIMVMVMVGVLAVFVAPKLNTSDFEARGFHDETLALLRYAQKTAVAQRRTVCVNLIASGVTANIFAANPATGTCAAAPTLAPPNSPRGGTGLEGRVNNAVVTGFLFTPLGITDQVGNVIIAIAGSTAITVETSTGYVHE